MLSGKRINDINKNYCFNALLNGHSSIYIYVCMCHDYGKTKACSHIILGNSVKLEKVNKVTGLEFLKSVQNCLF